MVHNYFNIIVIDESENFHVIQIELLNEKNYMVAIYILPNCPPPVDQFDWYKHEDSSILGDVSATHENWKCERKSVSGNKLIEWLNYRVWSNTLC